MKKKKSSRSKLVKALDTVWSKAIRKKYPRCVICGRVDGLSAHHCIKRKGQTTGVRWLENNGVSLCYMCHIHKIHGSQGDAVWLSNYLDVLHTLITDAEWLNVVQIGNTTTKYSIDDLKDLLATGWWTK